MKGRTVAKNWIWLTTRNSENPFQKGMPFVVEKADGFKKTLSFVDTYDWRLWAKGYAFSVGKNSVELYNNSCVAPIAIQEKKGNMVWSEDLSPGPCADIIQPLIGKRALCRKGEGDLLLQNVNLRNSDQKIVVRGFRGQLQTANGNGLSFVGLNPLRGYEEECAQIASTFVRFSPEKLELSKRVFHASGLDPSEFITHKGARFDCGKSFSEAARRLLLHLTASLRQNERGIQEDIDTECLHDYRVSLRKMRSFIGFIKPHLDLKSSKPYRAFLLQLQDITGRVRDLDVYLLNRDIYRELLPPEFRHHLDTFYHSMRKQRMDEWIKMVTYLQSSEYADNIDELVTYVKKGPLFKEGKIPESFRFAAALIQKRYDKITNVGDGINRASFTEDLHRLRILCKRLRYLLEFFGPLFQKSKVESLMVHMKQLQDNLGTFNDLAVQQRWFHRHLESVDVRDDVSRRLAGFLGALIASLYAKQREKQDQFYDLFRKFRLPVVRQDLLSLLGDKK